MANDSYYDGWRLLRTMWGMNGLYVGRTWEPRYDEVITYLSAFEAINTPVLAAAFADFESGEESRNELHSNAVRWAIGARGWLETAAEKLADAGDPRAHARLDDLDKRLKKYSSATYMVDEAEYLEWVGAYPLLAWWTERRVSLESGEDMAFEAFLHSALKSA